MQANIFNIFENSPKRASQINDLENGDSMLED
jgi:hypothetical protein